MSRLDSVGRLKSIITLAAMAMLLVACRYVDPYPEYRDVNLLEDRGLTAADFVPSVTTGDNSSTYIEYDGTLTAAEYGTTSGLPAGAEGTIHRVEVLNLLPNGDFETTGLATVPAGWEEKNDALFRASNDQDLLTGRSIEFEVGGIKAAIIDLNSYLLDSFADQAVYYFLVDFVRSDPETVIMFDYGDSELDVTYLPIPGLWRSDGMPGMTLAAETMPTPGIGNLDVVNLFASSNTGDDRFYVGSPLTMPASVGWLDNLRIGRAHTDPQVVLTIHPATGDQLTLPTGIYTFSVYVKSEIDDQVTPSANGLNRYRAGQLCIGAGTDHEIVTQAEGGWSSDRWIRVSRLVTLEEPEPDTEEGSLPTLKFSVSHQGHFAVGSLLIAAPSLELGDTR